MLNLKFVVLFPSEKCNAKPTNVVLLQWLLQWTRYDIYDPQIY
jgi:hypothetical protein